MLSLPQLIEEDIQLLDSALGDLITKSESTAALIIDKGGPLIIQKGEAERFDTTTMAALAAGSYAATQAIAGLVGELDFSSIYQQGQNFSILVNNIDDQLLLIVIFRANISVGAIKYYANTTITQVAEQIARARLRDPDTNIDLVSMNLLDTADVFRRPGANE
ncbi:MAG: roadblock/LC7 domain-containing protein [Opitutaceae bacterium]|nr:roadblock/LC7 domain-containing protein [Verrucomicrobiales bacterium]